MATAAPAIEAKLTRRPGLVGIVGFGVVLLAGVVYSGYHLLSDLATIHSGSITPYVLLGLALMVALGFEFVNGFHDTANAVATVIYTHSMEPHIAVMWSGFWNFVGVLTSSGLVAFGIISLLPVELILQVGSKAGFAMVFALLVGHHLELGDLVFRTARFEFSHVDWIDHWSWHRQSADVRAHWNERGGLGAGNEHRKVAAAVTSGWIRMLVLVVMANEACGKKSKALRGS